MLISATIPKASASDARLNRYMVLLLAVTNAVDLLASRRAFSFGVAELNPLVDLVISNYGIWTLGLIKAFWIMALAFFIPYIRGWTQALLGLSCIAYLIVTILHVANLSPLL